VAWLCLRLQAEQRGIPTYSVSPVEVILYFLAATQIRALIGDANLNEGNQQDLTLGFLELVRSIKI
jgi:hypothetical protein